MSGSRKAEVDRIRAAHPNRIPIYVETQKSLPKLDKVKYMVPKDLTIGQFQMVVRKRMKLDAGKAIFLFVDGVLPPVSSNIENMYNRHKAEDGFLYVHVAEENTFG